MTFNLPWRLSTYLAGIFSRWFLMMTLVLIILIGVFDFAELMRRASGKPLATVPVVFEMVALKMPTILQRLLPFLTLFGSLVMLWQLNRQNELTALKAAGLSVWQLLAPMMGVSLLINIVTLAVLNPMGAAMMTRYEQLEATYLKGLSHRVSVGETGFWIRQTDADGYTIIRAHSLSPLEGRLYDATFIRFTPHDHLMERLDAATAHLQEQGRERRWQLERVQRTAAEKSTVTQEDVQLPTPLTLQDITDSAVSPTSLSFWQLPLFILNFQKSGLSVVRHRVYWHGLLARSLFCIAMILLAACVGLRPLRAGRTSQLIATGAGVGFGIYVFSDITLALGYSSVIPPLLAAWGLPILATLAGVTTLLHLEDG